MFHRTGWNVTYPAPEVAIAKAGDTTGKPLKTWLLPAVRILKKKIRCTLKPEKVLADYAMGESGLRIYISAPPRGVFWSSTKMRSFQNGDRGYYSLFSTR